jgi:hypothetical protein
MMIAFLVTNVTTLFKSVALATTSIGRKAPVCYDLLVWHFWRSGKGERDRGKMCMGSREQELRNVGSNLLVHR